MEKLLRVSLLFFGGYGEETLRVSLLSSLVRAQVATRTSPFEVMLECLRFSSSPLSALPCTRSLSERLGQPLDFNPAPGAGGSFYTQHSTPHPTPYAPHPAP